jgi:hypothetical protein
VVKLRVAKVRKILLLSIIFAYLISSLGSSVADPDPYVFGPLASGSVRILLSSSKNSKRSLGSFWFFTTSLLLFIFEKLW